MQCIKNAMLSVLMVVGFTLSAGVNALTMDIVTDASTVWTSTFETGPNGNILTWFRNSTISGPSWTTSAKFSSDETVGGNAYGILFDFTGTGTFEVADAGGVLVSGDATTAFPDNLFPLSIVSPLNELFVTVDGGAPNTSFEMTVQAVPIPAAAWLFTSALGSLVFVRKRGKNKVV